MEDMRMGFNFFSNNNAQKDDSIKNIREKNITLNFDAFEIPITARINGAKYGNVSGEEMMLDEIVINSLFNDIEIAFNKNYSKYFPKPKKIFIELNGEDSRSKNVANGIVSKIKNSDKENAVVNIFEPKVKFEDVYVTEKTLNAIKNTITILKYKNKIFKEWKLGNSQRSRAIVLNFFGKPGTGKTMMAEAIGNYLGKKIMKVNYSELESKYVGDTPKNITNVFDKASKNDAILIFDEADSFLGKRLTNINQSSDYGVNITRSVMLMELEKFDGIVIFTTNLIKNYDSAFKRRILTSIEFMLPDYDGRIFLWKKITQFLPLAEDVNLHELAKRYDGVSGADIKDIAIYAAIKALRERGDNAKIYFADIEEACILIKNRYKEEKNYTVVTEQITKEQFEKETGDSNDNDK